MGMTASGTGMQEEDKSISEINVTPLVDVMLVLLIIFLITIPVITQSVPVELPKAANIPTQTKPENINIAVDAQGNVFWNTALCRARRRCSSASSRWRSWIRNPRSTCAATAARSTSTSAA